MEHDCSSHDMTTHFRRGQSKVYYASEVWDPGEDEEFARTSFRSGSGSEHSETLESYCNNDDFVASLMRRTSVEKSMYRCVKNRATFNMENLKPTTNYQNFSIF